MGVIGGFELIEPLGQGGMGEVHFAVSPTADRVALKVIKKELIEKQEVRERFAAEVESLRLVFGSRVARLEDADPYGDPAWLAVEYVPGRTLRQHVDDRGPLPLPLAAMVGAMLADGLGKVHQAGLLHRDVKPQNIILGPDGPKLIDFGLAVLIERGKEDQITKSGDLVGTPAYMTPEQVDGHRELTRAADIYALGATLVFALTGRGVYPGSANLGNLLRRISDPTDLPDLSGVPSQLAGLVGAMLAFDPGARPKLEDVRTRLLTVATGGGRSILDLRQAVTEQTYDPAFERLVPPPLQDPRQDPEAPLGADEESVPALVAPVTDTDAPPAAQPAVAPEPQNHADRQRGADRSADVAWQVAEIRRKYARRPTLFPSAASR